MCTEKLIVHGSKSSTIPGVTAGGLAHAGASWKTLFFVPSPFLKTSQLSDSVLKTAPRAVVSTKVILRVTSKWHR